MSSPVSIPFSSFIKIDRRKKDPVYLQIVYQFIQALNRHLLTHEDRLPGSRSIAADLQIHRKTVLAALGELQDQGYLRTVPGVGTFVTIPEHPNGDGGGRSRVQQPSEKATFTFKRDFVLDPPVSEIPRQLYFTDGSPDFKTVPLEELGRAYASVLRRESNPEELDNGNIFFREQLSYYLNVSRGFHLSRFFMLPLSSREQVFTVLSQLILSRGQVVLVEELSFYLANMIFSQVGARLLTIPVDADGMDVEYIAAHFKRGEVRAVYINPRSQYPTGVRLSQTRRSRLLELARTLDFVVIEDDVDFEFTTPKDHLKPLLRMEGGERVIYLGAFGRYLPPEFQMYFMIGPRDFIIEGEKYLNILGRPRYLMEKALGEIIHQGDIHRYQRKSSKLLSERKEKFAELLQLHLGELIAFSVPRSGLAFWIRFNRHVPLALLQEKAHKEGLMIPGLCLYQNKHMTALRLGFAHMTLKELEVATVKLQEAYSAVLTG